MSWIVAQTQPNLERTALAGAEAVGVEAYLPLTRVATVTRGRRCVRTEVLFPSYLFARMSVAWKAIPRLRGVSHVLMDGGEPGQIADRRIDQIMGMRDELGFVVLPDRPDLVRFRRGQRLQILNGAFRDLPDADPLYQGQGAHGRCQVLLSMFGARRLVAISEEDLAPAA